MSEVKSPSSSADLLYRYRWPAAIVSLLGVMAAISGGWGRVEHFSAQVAALGDTAPEHVEPQLFDPRSDIWFDPGDQALGAYATLESRFVPEDYIFLSFREPDDPLGAFGKRALETTAHLTAELEKVPFVRNVRSLTQNPWIRWGEVVEGEQGLLVGDMFENPPASYSVDQRIERMIAVLGAERAGALIGVDEVRRVLGADAKFEDHLGEPRLLKGVLSEDGRTSAIQVQVLRPAVLEDKLDEVFGAHDVEKRTVAPIIYKSTMHAGVVKAVDALVAAEQHYELHVTGVPVVEKHFQDIGQGDMQYVGLMFLIIAGALLIIYRRLAGTVIPLLVVFATILAMNGTVWLAGDLLNNLTAMAPTMMTGVAIADAVHLVTAYYLLRSSHTDKRSLIVDVFKRNALPVLLTSATTAMGFFSLSASVIDPVKKLGYTAGIGAVFAYLLSMAVIPALLSLIPFRPSTGAEPQVLPEDGSAWSDRLVDIVVANRKGLLVSTAVLFAVSIFGMSRLAFSTDMRLMFAPPDKVASDVVWFGDNLGGIGDLELLFYSSDQKEDSAKTVERQERLAALQVRKLGEGQPPMSAEETAELERLLAEEEREQRLRIGSSSAFLSRLDEFQAKVMQEGSQPGSPLAVLSRVDSGLDVLRKMHQVQNENRAAFYRVPTAEDVAPQARAARVTYDDILEESMYVPAQTADSLVAQYYLQYENGAKPSENLASLMTPDRRGFRMTLRFDHAPSALLLQTFDRIREIARDDFSDIAGTRAQVESGAALATMSMTGKQYMFTNMFRRFSETMATSLAIALACITALISIVFRSPLLGLLSLIPNVLPIILPLSVFGLLGKEIDGPAVVVASVALGVCVDDTIHMFTKFTHARREGYGADEALRRAFRQVGSALTWTTVVLMLGFSVLTLGNFRPNIVTGYLGAIMIGLAWVADFVLTPALLSYLGQPATVPATAPAPGVSPQT